LAEAASTLLIPTESDEIVHAQALAHRYRREGKHFLCESALDRVRLGVMTLREINKVTFIEAFR
jgi:hypothetical protein